MNAWINFAAILIGAIISGWAALKASRAERNSRPVSNGFTGYVLQDLRDIKAGLAQHIEDHRKSGHAD